MAPSTPPGKRRKKSHNRQPPQRVPNEQPRLAKWLDLRIAPAIDMTRWLLFAVVSNEKTVRALWKVLYLYRVEISWGFVMALSSDVVSVRPLDECKRSIQHAAATSNTVKDLQNGDVLKALGDLVVHAARQSFDSSRPLEEKMPQVERTRMAGTFDCRFLNELAAYRPWVQAPEVFRSWFPVTLYDSLEPTAVTMDSLSGFPRTAAWQVDSATRHRKRAAYTQYQEQTARLEDMRRRRRRLTDTRATLSPTETTEFEDLKKDINVLSAKLKKVKASLPLRARHYRLFPSPEQERKLKAFMGACRWTWNHCVAHFNTTSTYKPKPKPKRKTWRAPKKKTKKNKKKRTVKKRAPKATKTSSEPAKKDKTAGIYKASVLTQLYVTKQRKEQRYYPQGMGPAPAWVHRTPADIRQNVARRFEAAVTAAITNVKAHNIRKFRMTFKTKKKNGPFTTLFASANVSYLSPGDRRGKLTIPGISGIRSRIPNGTSINAEVKIFTKNGYWYADIPEYVEPQVTADPFRCIALDPGIKSFLTGVDLQGNSIHIGRRVDLEGETTSQTDDAPEQKDPMKKAAARIAEAQHAMDSFRSRKKALEAEGRRTTKKEYKQYARAKRTFNSATARLKNLKKEMHRKTVAYLTSNYDTIIIPEFRTQEMTMKSSPRTHGFNKAILSLNHFSFRKLLQAKCEVLGKSLVVSSEMYTSKTCGRCNRVHATLGTADIYRCPACGFTAGRDENAAFNILRFVTAGPLTVFEVNGVKQ